MTDRGEAGPDIDGSLSRKNTELDIAMTADGTVF